MDYPEYAILKVASPEAIEKGKRKPHTYICTLENKWIVESRPDIVGFIVKILRSENDVFKVEVCKTRETLTVEKDQLEMLPENSGIYIPFNVPSSKNSKIATSHGVFHSKTVQKYLHLLGISSFSSAKKEIFYFKNRLSVLPVKELKELYHSLNHPVEVSFFFVRDSKREFDFHNMVQLPFDIMTAADVIPDDSMKYVIPVCECRESKYYSVNNRQDGVWIKMFNRV